MTVTTGHGKPLIAGRMGSIKRIIGKSEVYGSLEVIVKTVVFLMVELIDEIHAFSN
jgi:hypothetical protein